MPLKEGQLYVIDKSGKRKPVNEIEAEPFDSEDEGTALTQFGLLSYDFEGNASFSNIAPQVYDGKMEEKLNGQSTEVKIYEEIYPVVKDDKFGKFAILKARRTIFKALEGHVEPEVYYRINHRQALHGKAQEGPIECWIDHESKISSKIIEDTSVEYSESDNRRFPFTRIWAFEQYKEEPISRELDTVHFSQIQNSEPKMLGINIGTSISCLSANARSKEFGDKSLDAFATNLELHDLGLLAKHFPSS
jgi:hypothetical protein